MMAGSTVRPHRPVAPIWRASVLIAVLSTSIMLPGMMGQAHAARLPQTGPPPLSYTGMTVSVPGQPFGVVATPDNQWLLVSITSDSSNADSPDGLAVFQRQGETMSLVRVIHFHPGYLAAGLALSANGKIALVTLQGDSVPSRIAVVDVRRATSGAGHAVRGYIIDAAEQGSIEVALSKDGHYAFVTDEGTSAVTVLKLPTGQNPTYGTHDVLGDIPVDSTPTGITVSPNGRFVYLVCQQSNTDPTRGVLTVVNTAKAEQNPGHAVVARVSTGPGSDPVRVIVDASGTDAWVTDRALNVVKAYSTQRLRTDPSHALLATTPVGIAPVGIGLIEHGTVVAVANSNRFSTTPEPETLSLLGTAAALAGRSALLGILTVGAFPRELAQSPDSQTLFVTNFDSNSVTAFGVSKLPSPT